MSSPHGTPDPVAEARERYFLESVTGNLPGVKLEIPSGWAGYEHWRGLVLIGISMCRTGSVGLDEVLTGRLTVGSKVIRWAQTFMKDPQPMSIYVREGELLSFEPLGSAGAELDLAWFGYWLE